MLRTQAMDVPLWEAVLPAALLALGLAATALTATLLVVRADDKTAAPAAPRPALSVTTTTPKSATLPLRISANGNIAAWQDRFRALPGFAPQLDLMPHDNWPPK